MARSSDYSAFYDRRDLYSVIPAWLHILSMFSLALGLFCGVIIAYDEFRHPQHMWIMNLAWPLVALFGSAVVLWAYFSYGRPATGSADKSSTKNADRTQAPFPVLVAKGTSHCGAGCTIGDICAEWLAFGVPTVAVWLGWKSMFSEKIFAVWVLDYVFAFVIGIAFQYFSIKPMRHLSVGQGLVQALKADSLSLTAWQIGMYGFMAIAYFWIFAHVLGVKLEVARVEFWFMMQIAMWCGFATSYPVNWWLISSGIKEKM